MAVATVIIPVGPRHVHLLPRAVESARAQTIPVDVMWFIDTEKRGPGYGRNILARQVKTPFLIMLDADDYLEPTFTEELLKFWVQSGSNGFVYSDWYERGQHVRGISCYGFAQAEGDDRKFMLPPSLFPTKIYHAIGGHDESLWGAEDTDFYLKANALGVQSRVLRKPLFHYTPDGYRSKEAASDPRWESLLSLVFNRYKGKVSMACCGKPAAKSDVAIGARLANDVIARPKWHARFKYRGKVSGRDYGRIGSAVSIWIDPRDLQADAARFEQLPNIKAIAPTTDEIKAALAIDGGDRVAQLEAAIRKAGVRIWGDTPVKVGFDMQQTPREAAVFLAKCEELGVKTVLEIGTGESAGFARFMTEVMGWSVTSVDMQEPKVKPTGDWTFVQSSSNDFELTKQYDMVFIDADHSLEQARADWDKYKDAGRIIGFHDISLEGWWADGCALVWKEISRTAGGKLRKGFGEHIEKLSKQGLGWFIHDAD